MISRTGRHSLNRMQRATRWILTGLLALVCFVAAAAEQSAASSADRDPKQSDKQGDPNAQSSPSKQENDNERTRASKSDPNEIFRPSEEISEDFAVSFPVDI